MMDQQHTDLQRQQFSTLLEGDYDYTRPRRGQVRQAVLLSVGENEVIVILAGEIAAVQDVDLSEAEAQVREKLIEIRE